MRQVAKIATKYTYIGQTRRCVSARFKEHIAHFKYNRLDKSSVVENMINNNHHIE